MGANKRSAPSRRHTYSKRSRKEGPPSRGAGHDSASSAELAESGDGAAAEAKLDKKPKSKVACLIGYCGTGYSGMQINPGVKTIEGEFFDAFVKAGAIAAYNADDPRKVSLARAARTDKGVHAALNVISLKLIDLGENAPEQINAQLPETMRVWKIIRVLGGFDPREFCDSRIYEYMIPTHCFVPPRPQSALARMLEAKARPDAELATEADRVARAAYRRDQAAFWARVDACEQELLREQEPELARELACIDDAYIQGEKREEAQRQARKMAEVRCKAEYRISPERLELVRSALRLYEGTHPFHNFTIGKSCNDNSVKRFMMRLWTGDATEIIEGTEWLSIKVHGQSFMLHQIRKMIGMVMLCVRAGTPLVRITEAFAPTKVNIPKAPGLGLLLERPFFASYYKRAAGFGRDPIDMDKPDFEPELEEFKHRHIYRRIFAEGAKDNTFHEFCTFMDNDMSDSLHYLSDEGITDKQAASDSFERLEARDEE